MTKQYDALVVLSGGINPDGTPKEWTKRRLDKAIELFNGSGYIVTTGRETTHHAPYLDESGYPLDVAVCDANYLIGKGIPKSNILVEKFCADTISAVYFTRVVHTDPAKLSKLVMITSDFHMPRSAEICKWIYGLTPVTFDYSIDFFSVSDDGIDQSIIDARRLKEKEDLEKLLQTRKGITSLEEFHRWFFTRHEAYSAGLTPTAIAGNAGKSY